MVDMPVEELRLYHGINPKPADFDDYWRNALEELAAVTPAVKLEPAEFQPPHVQCDHLWFTGTGGARLHAKLLRPRAAGGARAGAAVLRFHGYTLHSERQPGRRAGQHPERPHHTRT